MVSSEYLSIKEFANRLKLHPNTIRRMIKKKRIDALQINKGKRITYRICFNEINRMAQFDLKEFMDREIEKAIKKNLGKSSE